MALPGGLFLRLPGFAALAGISTFVSTRGGAPQTPSGLNLGYGLADGPATVAANRRRLFAALGIDPGHVVLSRQVHGRDLRLVTAAHGDGLAPPDRLPAADAMVTTSPGLWLAVLVADCVPVLAADPVARAVGVAHAGWRGTVAGVTAALLDSLIGAAGCRPEDLHVTIGPSIGPDDYRVGAAVARRFLDSFPGHADVVRHDRQGRVFVDLWRANVHQATAAGVPLENITVAGVSTASATDRFYSHRREGAAAGRFAVGIALV